jgi:hypothetical protein
MTKTLKKIVTYLTEWHMLKIYATVMTTCFLMYLDTNYVYSYQKCNNASNLTTI